MRPVRTVKMRGHVWRLSKVRKGSDYDGKCVGPHVRGKQMLLSLGAGTRHELEIVIHESLHACVWDLDEEAVGESALDIAAFLWRLGWRKNK